MLQYKVQRRIYMNKEYTYIDGKVIVRDSKGNQKQSEYYDNLEDVLIQENIIEKMESKINEIDDEICKIKKINLKNIDQLIHFYYFLHL